MTWLFFDMGWTLVDETGSQEARLRLTRDALATRGISRTVGQLWIICEDASTRFLSSPFMGMLEALGFREDDRRAILAQSPWDHGPLKLYPGVPELLESLHGRYDLGVIANQSAGAEDRLRAWGIRDYFDVVLASAELGLEKPDPRIFECALEQAGCRPADAVMIGDRIDNDIAPANAAGWRTIRVLEGLSRFQVPRTRQESADDTIETLNDLPDALRRIGC
ncbi:MAG: HAD family hydrolase [bacterium]|nr:HAD family hydrolase [bacterium]